MIRRAMAVFILIAGGGCASGTSVQVEPAGVITQRADTALAGTISVRIANHGELEVQAVEYTYTVTTASGPSWTGRQAGEIVLAPGSERVAELAIVVPAGAGGWTDGGPSIIDAHVRGSLMYIGRSVQSETMADLGYEPIASFAGPIRLTAGTDRTPG